MIIPISLTGCDNSKYTDGYNNGNKGSITVSDSILTQFPGFTYDDNEGQYYMSDNSAAAENGYYFITQNASENGTNNFIYYYDMTSQTSVPLCSKLNCQHNDTSCDAYISDVKCLGEMIWYYGGRIYMIERSSEKDILISYDSEGRNRKEVCTLSEGKSVVGFKTSGSGAACVSGGYLYFVLYDSNISENNMKLKRFDLKKSGKAEELGSFTMSSSAVAGAQNCFKFYPIRDKIYLFVGAYTHGSSKNTYRVLQYDCTDNRFLTLIDLNKEALSGVCRGEIINWCKDNVIDSEGNIYYLSWIQGEKITELGAYNGICILNQYNLSTKKNKELYVLEGSDSRLVSSDVLSISGYDGNYVYLYEGVKVTKKKTETPLEDSNQIIVMDSNGGIIDSIHFNINEEMRGYYALNIDIKLWGGDRRYLMIATTRPNVMGMEFSDSLMKSKDKWNSGSVAKQVTITPQAVAVIDKNQIGTGSFSLIKIKE